MKVAVVTSVSKNIAPYAVVTLHNKAVYCLMHDYTLVADNAPYEEAVRGVGWLATLFERYDLLWTLDADAVITDLRRPIHDLPCLGPHVTVCEEGIVPWNRLNCGSIVWRATPESAGLLRAITAREAEWWSLPCGWQTWLDTPEWIDSGVVTVAPLRAFNSCEWTKPGNGAGPPGSHWQPGDMVYHPCGVYPLEERMRRLDRAVFP